MNAYIEKDTRFAAMLFFISFIFLFFSAMVEYLASGGFCQCQSSAFNGVDDASRHANYGICQLDVFDCDHTETNARDNFRT